MDGVWRSTRSTFTRLSQPAEAVTDDDLQKLEQFVIIMYDKSSAATSVNDARLDLFARKQRQYESIPPTRAALVQQAKRAAYQAGWIWIQATAKQPDTTTPLNLGWTRHGETWQVCWTTLPPIASCCQELTKCSCKLTCSSRCKCQTFGFCCTALCGCACEN